MISKGQENLIRHSWWEALREARKRGWPFSELGKDRQHLLFGKLV
jgi:hypothetical protein